jgi:predicted RNA-binding protein Jag
MSYPSDKFLLVDAKTAAKQADEVKAKQDAKLKEERVKKQADFMTKTKVEIAAHVNKAIDEGKHEIFFHMDQLDDDQETWVANWLESLGYSAEINEAIHATTVKINW